LLDIYSATACFALIAAMKNEGLFIISIGAFVLFTTLILSSDQSVFNELREMKNKIFIWLVFLFSPSIIWSIIYKHAWGFANDLQIGTSGSFATVLQRLHDGSLPVIIKTTLFHDHGSVWLPLTIFSAMLFLSLNRKKYSFSWMPALFMAASYYSGLIFIYLMSPHDLHWHLATSISRTMLTFNGCIIVAIFYMWEALEETPDIKSS
jgi:hypothetical protein